MPMNIEANAGLGYIVRLPVGSTTHKMFREQFPDRVVAAWSPKENGYVVKGTSASIKDGLERFNKAAQPVVAAEDAKLAKAIAFIKSVDIKTLPGVELAIKDGDLAVRVPNIKAVTDVLRIDGQSKWVPQFRDAESGQSRGGYDKMPVNDLTLKVLQLASHTFTLQNTHAIAAIQVPHHESVTLSTAVDRDRKPFVVVAFPYDKAANDIMHAELDAHGLKLNKAAGGWVVPLAADTAKVLAPAMEKLTEHLQSFSQAIQPSMTHPGITIETLRAQLTLPTLPEPEHAKHLTEARDVVMKGFSAEERQDLKELTPETADQSTSPRIAALSPETFKLASDVVKHVEGVLDHIQSIHTAGVEAKHAAMQAEQGQDRGSWDR